MLKWWFTPGVLWRPLGLCQDSSLHTYERVCMCRRKRRRWFIRDWSAVVVPLVRLKGGMNQRVALPRPRNGAERCGAARRLDSGDGGLFLNGSGGPFIRFSGQRPRENSFSLSSAAEAITRFIPSARVVRLFSSATFRSWSYKAAAIAAERFYSKNTQRRRYLTRESS